MRTIKGVSWLRTFPKFQLQFMFRIMLFFINSKPYFPFGVFCTDATEKRPLKLLFYFPVVRQLNDEISQWRCTPHVLPGSHQPLIDGLMMLPVYVVSVASCRGITRTCHSCETPVSSNIQLSLSQIYSNKRNHSVQLLV